MHSIAASAAISQTGGAFDALLPLLQAQFEQALAAHGPALFHTTPAADLYDLYLDTLPAAERQHHTCHACREFLRRYGDLAVIAPDGTLTPAVWPATAPEPYGPALGALARAVSRAPVRGVALFREPVWGTPETGAWTHFALRPPAGLVFRDALLTAGQAMAAKLEDARTLRHGLAAFDRATVAQAVTLLETEALYRSEKVIGPARFLLALHDACAYAPGRQRANLVWRAVATAPAGFCQPRSTMVGTLLADLADGLDFAAVKRRFDAKLHPLRYQRPQAAPAAGTIAQAEQLIAQLGLAPALRRRFARLEEIAAVWRPAPAAPVPGPAGVFGHLRPKGAEPLLPLSMPAQAITWTKFARTVLPAALSIAVYCAPTMNLCALVTAADPEAKPILQWDLPERRNPCSWYVYPGGSRPEQWGLTTGGWASVTAVTLQPSLWHEAVPAAHHGQSAIFVLAGARDSREAGLALFPKILQASLHGVRAVIEAYSQSRQLEGREEASACGLRVGDASGGANQIRVTTDTGVATYTIDRWE